MPRYIASMSPAVKTILELMASWPVEDQEELSELAREIEARRTGVYRLSEEERAAIDAARRGPLAADDEVEAFWKRRGALLELVGKLEWDETHDYKAERGRG